MEDHSDSPEDYVRANEPFDIPPFDGSNDNNLIADKTRAGEESDLYQCKWVDRVKEEDVAEKSRDEARRKEERKEEDDERTATPRDKRETRESQRIIQMLKPTTEKTGWPTGFHLHFLPRVEKFKDALEKNNESEESDALSLEIFEQCYMLPNSFWDVVMAESNGFYSRWDPAAPSNMKESNSHWSMCRFLIKNYQPVKEASPDSYEWNYVTICSLWFQKDIPDRPKDAYTQIYLCFDIPDRYRRAIADRCRAAGDELLHGCPFAGYGLIMQSVIDFYNDSLWKFRQPVRSFEKARAARSIDQVPSKALKRTLTGNMNPGSDAAEMSPAAELKSLMHPFQGMAELNRHLIHAQETLAAAINTMQLMVQDHNEYCPQKSNGGCVRCAKVHASVLRYTLTRVSRSFTCHISLLSNLKYRAEAFEKRLNNEISHAFNLIAVEENFTTKQLLRESRKDERELSTLVSLLTLAFLPGTFISGFFGMNFFNFDGRWKVSPAIWLFFAISGPITIVAFFLWAKYTDRKWSIMVKELLATLGNTATTEKKETQQQESPPEEQATQSVPLKTLRVHLEQNASPSSSTPDDEEAQLGTT